MSISLIVCCDEDFAIGSDDNNLLYYIRNDLRRFKEITTNNYVVMGKNTYLSLPNLLPRRTNVVLTRDESFVLEEELYEKYDVIVEHDLVKILNQYRDTGKQDKELFLIGGSHIFAEGVHWADKIYMTMVHKSNHPKAKVYFPKQELSEFEIESKEKLYDEESGLYYSFINYKRKENVDGN